MATRENLSRKPLLSVDEAAILLGQSRSSLYRSVKKGDLPLPIFQINGRWRIPRRAVERFLEGELVPLAAGFRSEALMASPMLPPVC